jgi:hypothetical protein
MALAPLGVADQIRCAFNFQDFILVRCAIINGAGGIDAPLVGALI